MSKDQEELKNLAHAAYLSALSGKPLADTLDKLQEAYWKGLFMLDDYIEYVEKNEGDPPF